MDISQEPGLYPSFPQLSSSTPKRPRSSSENSTDTLQPDDYTIGWISALPIEMMAAEVMLDRVHDGPPQRDGDSNCYIFGSIKSHNIVMACLPSGHYGTNNAATVASHMSQSFPNIQHRLMVGIGGGAPGLADVRLGDIVVSNDVVQYDLVKALPDNKFERTAYPVRPPQPLLTAVSRLRAGHGGGSTQISDILQQSVLRLPLFARPKLQDLLFHKGYDHPSFAKICEDCDQQQLVPRDPPQTSDPKIHYGRIASGNQVIKDGFIRDRLSQELGSICFEMEAAGLIHSFPCLVVRGICDYSDSHKNKDWQEYAALVAAAYAKDLILTLPSQTIRRRKKGRPSQPKAAKPIDPDTVKCLQELFVTDASQDREDILDAKGDICRGTCEWILSTQELKAWEESSPHLLWISAPPGMGKTFLSIFLSKYFEDMCKGQTDVATIFFFCDNKVASRNTGVNILRGLLTQLIAHQEDLVDKIMVEWRQKSSKLFQDSSFNTLWRVFEDMIRGSNFRSIYCIIDALDECEDDSLTILLKKFKKLGQSSTASYTKLKLICLSRRFPERIPESLDAFTKVELDMMAAGKEDVRRFISERISDLSRTKKLSSSMRKRIEEVFQEKSEGTFLWASFMAQDLETKSKLEIVPSLDRLPSGLDAVYERILSQIDFNKWGIIQKMLDWILIATRPLRIPELCEAAGVQATASMCRESVCEELIKVCGHLLLVESHEQEKDRDIRHMILPLPATYRLTGLDTEPGSQLVSHQVIVFWSTQVTFLHQSAKDYYITMKHKRGSESPESLLQSLHESAASQLIGYFSIINDHPNFRLETVRNFRHLPNMPLMLYATEYWDFHFRQLEDLTGIMEQNKDFISHGSRTRLISISRDLVVARDLRQDVISLLHLSCFKDLSNLTTWCLARKEFLDLERKWGRLQETPLLTACRRGYETIVNILLDAGAKVWATDCNGQSTFYHALVSCDLDKVRKMTQAESCKYWLKQQASNPHSELLVDVALRGNEAACRLLVEKHSFYVNIKGPHGFSPVMMALKTGKFKLVHTFVHEWKAHFDNWMALQVCFKDKLNRKSVEEMIAHVVHHYKVDINTTVGSGDNILWSIFKDFSAFKYPLLPLLNRLLELGLDIDRANNGGETPLHGACSSEQVVLSTDFTAVIRWMMDHSQLDMNKTDQRGKTALHCLISALPEWSPWAIRAYSESALQSLVGLLDLGVDRYIKDLNGRLALHCLQDIAKKLGLKERRHGHAVTIERMAKFLENYQTVPARIRR
ncbi:hypothetical protein ACHAQK_009551 [Fusarium lateritium]